MAGKNSRFRCWIKEHDHLLTLVGAVIVFSTFVIKEGLGERWKATAEALETAQQVQSLRSLADEENEKLTGLHSRIGEVYLLILSHGSREERRGVDQFVVDYKKVDFNGTFDRGLAILNSVTILVNQFPDDEIYRDRGNKLIPYKEKLKNLRGTTDAMRKLTFADDWRRLSNDAKKQEIDNQNSWSDDIGVFSSSALEAAENLVQANGTRAKYASRVSIVLFAFGWSLGLVGKLYGVPELVGGD